MSGSRGRYFDGQTAMRHRVDAVFDRRTNELVISGDTLPVSQRWPAARIRALKDEAHEYRLTITVHSAGNDEAQRDAVRLSVSDPGLISELKRSCPELHRKDFRSGFIRRIAIRSALAAAAVVVVLFVLLPRMADTLARFIPVERETAMGKSVVAQIERALGGTERNALRCFSRGGQAALETMVVRLTQAQELEYQVNVLVFDHDMINAFAAPGGQIVLLRGLLDNADGPEELAGVLAHELGHVVKRDPIRYALQTAGSAGILSLVLGDFSGGALTVLLGNWLLKASYTREAEAEADRLALEMLNSAGIDSGGLATFFTMVASSEDSGPDLPAYFSTHPAASERADLARKNSRTQRDTAPVLSDREWQALKTICNVKQSEQQ